MVRLLYTSIMKSRFITIGITLSVLLIACAPEVTGPLTIGDITAGTRHTSTWEIADKGTVFKPTDNPLFFNVEMENVTEPTVVMAYWIIENDTGSFARFPLTVTTDDRVARFELPKDSLWPAANYAMYVEVGTGSTLISKTFQYQIRE